ncbi:hypothetical protein ACH5A3_34900 [Streptomyces echinatus]|uniref:hypothetical protein n=1 Tax=Streptomyces echinatus TaxID=67293 RepID=UPI0037B870C2
MTTRPSSPCPDDSLITPAPAATGLATPPPKLLMWPLRPPEGLPDAQPADDPESGDPLQGLVHAAVADRPLEDVVRLITLLESSPEHARIKADALRAVAVDRSVEDLARLVTLLTEPPRETGSADEAIRVAAERRPLEDVSRLMQLLHRRPLEPHCWEEAVRAVAVHRPVEELAELIGRLAEDRKEFERRRSEPVNPGPVSPGPTDPEPRNGEPPVVEPPGAGPAYLRPTNLEPPGVAPACPERAPAEPMGSEPAGPWSTAAATAPGLASSLRVRPAGARQHKTRQPRQPRVADARAGDGPLPGASVWAARGAALLVLLCGLAHVPRYWAGLSHGVLGATLLASAVCGLLALALTARAASARLVAATAAVGVTAALAAGHVLGGRFGLPDPARLQAATLAPSWLAGPVAAAAALGALSVLLTGLTLADAQREGVR